MENDSVVGRYKIRDFLREKGLTIVPCVNPDGVEIAIHGSDAALKYKALVEKASKENKVWQANARGVDINHNFNAGTLTVPLLFTVRAERFTARSASTLPL